MNRIKIASELLKIARDVLEAGVLDEPQYDTDYFEKSVMPRPNEYLDPPVEPMDPASEVTHCQCSVNPT